MITNVNSYEQFMYDRAQSKALSQEAPSPNCLNNFAKTKLGQLWAHSGTKIFTGICLTVGAILCFTPAFPVGIVIIGVASGLLASSTGLSCSTLPQNESKAWHVLKSAGWALTGAASLAIVILGVVIIAGAGLFGMFTGCNGSLPSCSSGGGNSDSGSQTDEVEQP